MSHFGLTTPLPIVEASAPKKEVLYGLFAWMRRDHFEDGGGDSSEHLCFVHADANYIRSTMNKLWENPDLFQGKPNKQLAFPEGGIATNQWYSDGGGCAAKGGYIIRAMATASDYVGEKQAWCDKRQAERDAIAERERLRKEKEAAEKVRQAERDAYWANRSAINEKHRAWRAANKDEVNEKQRVYRKAQRAKKKEKRIADQIVWDAFCKEWKEYQAANPEISEREAWLGRDMYFVIREKYYPTKVKK